MTEEAIQGVCEECGKVYRVPSADRTYRCKGCGGTVSVDDEEYDEDDYDEEEEEEEEEEVAPRRRRRRRDDDEEEDEDDEDDEGAESRSVRELHTYHRGKRDTSTVVWLAMAVVLIIGAVLLVLDLMNLAPWSERPEKDLGVITASLVEEWDQGDVEGLVAFYHPASASLFREQLDNIRTKRGWDGAFPAATSQSAKVVEGTVDQPAKGESSIAFGEGETVDVYWQFLSSSGHWRIYAFEPSPPPISTKVGPFKEGWAKSDPEALRPFFRPGGAVEMIERVQDEAKKERWGKSYPTLGDHTVVVKDDTVVEVNYSTPQGEMMVRWKFLSEPYEWYVSQFRFP